MTTRPTVQEYMSIAPVVVSSDRTLAEAHRLLYRAKVGLEHAREILRSNGQLVPHVQHLLNFVDEQHQGRHGRGREHNRRAA